jgi:hypothetical protein
LRLTDEPLRKAAIDKATKDHERELLEKEKINKGNLFSYIIYLF